MPKTLRADIVFVLDASGSVTACINAVKKHIHDFVEVFEQDARHSWDLRLEFVAHTMDGSFNASSVHHDEILPALHEADVSSFFTDSVEDFQTALAKVRTGAVGCPFLALGFALDLPWRAREDCWQVVILLSDEPAVGTERQGESEHLVSSLIEKIHQRGIMLHLIAPESELFDELSCAHGCHWRVVAGGEGLATVDFHAQLRNVAEAITGTFFNMNQSGRLIGRKGRNS